jgi:bla regulator protein BlaR1
MSWGSVILPLFDWTWRNSLEASVLIVVALALRSLAGGSWPVRWRYWLGLLLVLRLVLPVAPPASFSVFNALRHSSPPPRTASGPVAFVSIGKPVTTPVMLPPARPTATFWSGREGLALAWMAGTCVSFFLVMHRHFRFKAWVEATQLPVDDRIGRLLLASLSALGVRRQVEVVLVPELETPAVFGFFRPRVLLPRELPGQLDEDQMRMVLLHEIAHVKRGDVLWNWFFISVRAWHWFNPLAWLALRVVQADRELVCDALVLSRIEPRERRVYGATLIKLVESISKPSRFSTAVPILNPGREMKWRITMIAKAPAPKLMIRMAWAVALLALCGLTFTRAAETPPASASATTPRVRSNGIRHGVEELRKQLAQQEQDIEAMQKGISDYQAKASSGIWPGDIVSRLQVESLSIESSLRQLETSMRTLQAYAPPEQAKVVGFLFPDEGIGGAKDLGPRFEFWAWPS